jgi:hypothetical protein
MYHKPVISAPVFRVCNKTTVKNLENTLANIKQLADDNYRQGQRITTMQAAVYTALAYLTSQPGYGDLDAQT